MHHHNPARKYTIGQALAYLRFNHCRDSRELYTAINVSSSTYLKIERDQRDLSFVMALRICQFYDLDVHEFISMIADAELERKDISTLKILAKRKKKQDERDAIKSKIIDVRL